jgi:hypothetical protein
VHFLEQIVSRRRAQETGGFAFFNATCETFGLADDSTLVFADDHDTHGTPWTDLLDLAESASLLVNLGGHLTLEPLRRRFRRAAYVDIDPGFTQFWHADPQTNFRVPPHDFYYTIAANIGSPDCVIPTGDITWQTMRQPVVLQDWPAVMVAPDKQRFTTVASWRGAFAPVSHGGRQYGVKAHEFRKFAALPRLAAGDFELALDIHPGDARDLELLRDNGWQLVDPRTVAGDAAAFRRYVQGSSAEFSVAQGIYVDTNSGWFSDRTIRYLASGRPALLQDTGFSCTIPAGEGLIAFRTIDEAVDGVNRVAADYPTHCEAARRIAEELFDSDKVLGQFLDEVGVHS